MPVYLTRKGKYWVGITHSDREVLKKTFGTLRIPEKYLELILRELEEKGFYPDIK